MKISKGYLWVSVLAGIIIVIQFISLTGCNNNDDNLAILKAKSKEATIASDKLQEQLTSLFVGKINEGVKEFDIKYQLDQLQSEFTNLQKELQNQVNSENDINKKIELNKLLDRKSADINLLKDRIKKANEITTILDNKIAKVNQATSEAMKLVDNINSQIQDAENLGEAVSPILDSLAPLAGAYAPFVLLGSNILTGLFTHKKSKQSAVAKIVLPIEAARNKDLESKLNAESGEHGKNYIVFDKGATGTAHNANGVGSIIKLVT